MSTYIDELNSLNELWDLKKFLKKIKIIQKGNNIYFFLDNNKYGTIINICSLNKYYYKFIIFQDTNLFHSESIKKENKKFIQDLDGILFDNKLEGYLSTNENNFLGVKYHLIKETTSGSFLSKEKENLFFLKKYDHSMEFTTILKNGYDIFYILLIGSLYIYYSEKNIIESLKKYYNFNDKNNEYYNDIIDSLGNWEDYLNGEIKME